VSAPQPDDRVARTAWEHPEADEDPDYPALVAALRDLQDQITGTAAPADVLAEVAATVRALADRMAPFAAPDVARVTRHLMGFGRGGALGPALLIDEVTEDSAAGRVRFGRFHLGGRGAVHGGAIPLIFDEAMGWLANTNGRSPARTAFLHVDFRAVTPVETELQVRVRVDRQEGRKCFLRGTLHDGDTLCAEAEGLFVALKPGQP
jgi:acyl-coenzyme A thioesterase PaaI-like protein